MSGKLAYAGKKRGARTPSGVSLFLPSLIAKREVLNTAARQQQKRITSGNVALLLRSKLKKSTEGRRVLFESKEKSQREERERQQHEWQESLGKHQTNSRAAYLVSFHVNPKRIRRARGSIPSAAHFLSPSRTLLPHPLSSCCRDGLKRESERKGVGETKVGERIG